MRLVPRQLQRSGMTGNVPYYGGRFSPAQAYAASHPNSPMPSGVPAYSGRMTPPQTMAVAHPLAATGTLPAPPPASGPALSPGPASAAAPSPAGDLEAVRRLAAAGVITPAELAAIEGRMA